jgi:transcriptional regulator with PAS, ATPase and Fis domain
VVNSFMDSDYYFSNEQKFFILEQLINNAFEGIIVVNKECNVVFVDKKAADIIGLPEKQIIGKHVNSVIPTSRLPITVETGKEEIGWLQKVGKNQGIVGRFPIIVNSKIIGAIGFVIHKNLNSIINVIENIQINYGGSILKEEQKFSRIGSKYTFDNFIGQSKQIKDLISYCKKISNSYEPILITGETGTGKEILAHALHAENRHTCMSPLIGINCSAIPNQLLESELFGYEKGAFTGAEKTGKQGKFELAGNGTILLDEIGEMDLMLQSKLLRVIENHEFERVGSLKLLPLNARIISITNQNLKKLHMEGKFRKDLYYRLNVFEVEIPPLRERREDIVVLLEYFKDQFDVYGFSDEVVEILTNYNWPGNVREMKNFVKRISNIVERGTIVKTDDLPIHMRQNNRLFTFSKSNEDNKIFEALNKAGGNKTKAAQILGISRATLYNKLKNKGGNTKSSFT